MVSSFNKETKTRNIIAINKSANTTVSSNMDRFLIILCKFYALA